MEIAIKCGDALELIKKQPDNSVDLIITSPPYMDMKNYGNEIENRTDENYVTWLLTLFVEVERVLKPSGSFILNINENCKKGLRSTIIFDLISRNSVETKLKFYDYYIWHKKNAIPNSAARRFRHNTEWIFHFCKDSKKMKFYMPRVLVPSVSGGKIQKIISQNRTIDGVQSHIYRNKKMPVMARPDNVFRFNTAGASRDNTIKHPAPFNKELPAYFINLLTDVNDLVIDTFSGIGTTGLACKELNRNYIGYELHPPFVNFSRKRLNIQPAITIKMNDIKIAA